MFTVPSLAQYIMQILRTQLFFSFEILKWQISLQHILLVKIRPNSKSYPKYEITTLTWQLRLVKNVIL